MARTLGRNARNRLWEGLGDGDTTAMLKRIERAKEKQDWQEDEGLIVRERTRKHGKKRNKADHRHKRIAVEGNNCRWEREEWPVFSYSRIRAHVTWVCECRSICTKCGDNRRRGSWRKDRCFHNDLKEATQPDEVGYIYVKD